jgi:hypothetical protein
MRLQLGKRLPRLRADQSEKQVLHNIERFVLSGNDLDSGSGCPAARPSAATERGSCGG